MCVREREIKREIVCVCVKERTIKRERVCERECVCERERVCVCERESVCVREKESLRGAGGERAQDRESQRSVRERAARNV